MSSITGIIIAKNEENLIVDCLESLSFCSEIILVDNSSTDNTVAIAKQKGVKIIPCSTKDFAALRNEGLKSALSEYVLYVDSDERVSKELQKSILDVLQKNEQEVVAYRVRRKNFYLGNYEWPHIERLERFFKRQNLKGWHGKLHESPLIEGKIGELDGYLLHYSHRDLSSMLNKTIQWSDIEAQFRFNQNHPPMAWWRFPRVMVSAFLNSYISQEGWRAGTMGFIESIYQSFSMFITYAKLWELQEERKKKNEK